MTDNRQVREAKKFSGISLGNKVKLEVMLEGGRLFTSNATFTHEDADHKLQSLLKNGVHPVALRQEWTFTGRQW